MQGEFYGLYVAVYNLIDAYDLSASQLEESISEVSHSKQEMLCVLISTLSYLAVDILFALPIPTMFAN